VTKPGPGRGKKTDSDATRLGRGTAYLAARLKRDRPDLLQAVADGEMTVRAAANNKQLEIDAIEIRHRSERRLGAVIKAQKATVGLNTSTAGAGRPSLGGSTTEPPKDTRARLAEAGIDKKLSRLGRGPYGPRNRHRRRSRRASALSPAHLIKSPNIIVISSVNAFAIIRPLPNEQIRSAAPPRRSPSPRRPGQKQMPAKSMGCGSSAARVDKRARAPVCTAVTPLSRVTHSCPATIRTPQMS
jgi:hypothetical protein